MTPHLGTVWDKQKEKEKEEVSNTLDRPSSDSNRPKGTVVDRNTGRAGPYSPRRDSPPRNNAHLSFTAPRILSTPIPDRHSDRNLERYSSFDRYSDSCSDSDSDVSPSQMHRIGSVSTISAYEKEKESSARIGAMSSNRS